MRTRSEKTSKTEWIRAQLRDLIGRLGEGTRLPSERLLAQRFGIARTTLRNAMDDLLYDGLIVRQHGRGVFAARPKVVGRMDVTSFTEDMHRRGETPTTRVIAFRTVQASRYLARRLRMPMNDAVYVYTRVRLAGGVPLAVQQGAMVAAAVPDLSAEDLAGSLYESLRQRHGITIIGSTLDVEAVLPDDRAQSLLVIPQTQPCIQLRGFGMVRGGRVVEFGTSLFRGDRYRLGNPRAGSSGRRDGN